MPAPPKKYEARRSELFNPDGLPFTMGVTTRELIWMIKA